MNRTDTDTAALALPASDTLPAWLATDDKMAVLGALDDYLNGDAGAVNRMVRARFGYRGADAARATRRYKAMLVNR